jgi:hypothetical protein
MKINMKKKNNTIKNKKHNKNNKSKKIRKKNSENKKIVKGQLFSDDNPETTVHGYGFSNLKIANKTLDDLKNRDIDYQFQVINTMYHRGIQVLKKTNNLESKKSINKALDIFRSWLNNYKSQNKGKEYKHYLTPKEVSSLEFLADYYNISRKARGLEKPTTSDKGFLEIWRQVKGDKKKLRNYPVKSKLPNGQTWDKQRNNYIIRRLSMMKNAKDKLYYEKGIDKGLPTKLHVNMIMWAYSPDYKNVLNNITNYKKIIQTNNLKK